MYHLNFERSEEEYEELKNRIYWTWDYGDANEPKPLQGWI